MILRTAVMAAEAEASEVLWQMEMALHGFNATPFFMCKFYSKTGGFSNSLSKSAVGIGFA